MNRPFRFGLVESGATPWEDWPDLVRRVEDAGYGTLQVAHHLSLPTPPPLPALAAASVLSRRLRLGTLVLDTTFLDPMELAKDAAWLARTTGARFELGLGAGWLAADHEMAGQSSPPAAERVTRLEDAVLRLRSIWAGVAGRENGVALASERPPLLIGGGGPRMLRIAAEHADIVSIAPDMRSGRIGSASARTATLPETARRAAAVRTRAPDAELHTTLTAVIGDDTERAARTAAAFDVPVNRLDEVPGVLVGSPRAMADQLRALREAAGITYVSVPSPSLDAVAPVVAVLR